MSQCPYCQSEISDDFGLVTCKSCGQSIMISIDGHIQKIDPSGVDPGDAQDLSSGEVGGEEFEEDYPSEPLPEQPLGPDSEVQALELAQDSYEEEAVLPEIPSHVDPAPFEEDPLGGDLKEAVPPPETDASFGDVVSFANSDSNQWTEGNIKYKVIISGVDSAELKLELKLILSEPRFMWDHFALMSSIKAGELILNDISAVKASVLVKRLRPLSVGVRWEQYVLQQP